MWNIRKHLEFLFAFTRREITTRYKHTVLGFLWVFLNPLIQMLVVGIIITRIFSPPIPNYFLFLFSGLLPWNFFALSLDKATTSLYWNRELLKKAKFPREAIPVSIVLAHGFHFMVALLLLLFFIVFISGRLPASIFLLPVAILWLVIFTVGLVLLTSSLEVYFRDISFIVKALLIVWFYATPILYPVHLIPSSFLGLLRFNPLFSVLALFHQSFFPEYSTSLLLIIPGLFLSMIVVGAGIMAFRKLSPDFVDWL